MTRSLDNLDGLSAPDAKVLDDIRTEGFHITGVFATKDETGPDWAFSIGLFHSFGHPEVVVFGLELKICMDIISGIGRGIAKGRRYEEGKQYGDILNDPYKCKFREVRSEHYEEYLGFALWFYERDPFPVIQCFWPHKKEKFPWEEECNRAVRPLQPLLFYRKAN